MLDMDEGQVDQETVAIIQRSLRRLNCRQVVNIDPTKIEYAIGCYDSCKLLQNTVQI